MEKELIKLGKQINLSYIDKFTHYGINSDPDWMTCCYTTKKALLYIFECKSCHKNDSNFMTIYIEYKNVGHVCCIYDNKIFQSFGGYYYLDIKPLHIPVEELLLNIVDYIDLFYPADYLKLDKADNLYVRASYYYTGAGNEKIIENLHKLCK